MLELKESVPYHDCNSRFYRLLDQEAEYPKLKYLIFIQVLHKCIDNIVTVTINT